MHLLRKNMSKTVDIDALRHSWSHSVPAGLACTAYLALHLRSAALACAGRHRVASVTAEPTSKELGLITGKILSYIVKLRIWGRW